jgi:hypothetical protein
LIHKKLHIHAENIYLIPFWKIQGWNEAVMVKYVSRHLNTSLGWSTENCINQYVLLLFEACTEKIFCHLLEKRLNVSKTGLRCRKPSLVLRQHTWLSDRCYIGSECVNVLYEYYLQGRRTGASHSTADLIIKFFFPK